jgi:hypothetical protein
MHPAVHSSLDSIRDIMRRLEPSVNASLSKSWLEYLLVYVGPVVIPVLIFLLGYYYQKLREHNNIIEHLQSYKKYCFNCVEILYASCMSQAQFISKYTPQFKSYALTEYLTIISSYSAHILDRIDFAEFYSSCVEHAIGEEKSNRFKMFQESLSITSDILQDILPIHKEFTDRYFMLERRIVDGIQRSNQIGSQLRSYVNDHPFFLEIMQTLKNNSNTSKSEYFINCDELLKLCGEITQVCDKYYLGQSPAINSMRTNVEAVYQAIDNDVYNMKSLFTQYEIIFNFKKRRLEEAAKELKSFSEEIAKTQLHYRKVFRIIGKGTLEMISVNFTYG